MEQKLNTTAPDISKYTVGAWAKFLIMSGFGIFAFFINFPLPAYQITIGPWEWGSVAATSTMLVTHLSNLIRAMLWTGSFNFMAALIWCFGAYCLYDMFKLNPSKAWRSSTVNRVFSFFKLCGFVFVTVTAANYYFGVVPPFFGWYFDEMEFIGGSGIAPFVLNRILVSVTITIPLAAAFLPFLTGYGIVDFFGVFMRRIMRPVFKLPGRASVISVSALLASFVVGFLGASQEYNTGKMTRKETMIIAYSLSSASIGFLLVIGGNVGIMHMWNAYLWSSFALILLVTVITVRIPPLSRIPDTFKKGVEPTPEVEYTRHILKNAFNEALATSTNSARFGKQLIAIMKEMLAVLGNSATCSTFFAAIGIALYAFTPIINWAGYIFYPFMRLFVPANEAMVGSAGVALGFIEITLPSLLVIAGEWTLRLRFILAVVPIASIIFIAAWVPTILAMPLPVKFTHIMVIWFERVILSVLFAGVVAMLLFPAGAV